jgi:hypothetical protein
VWVLDASGLERAGGARTVAEWAFLSIASAGAVASLWSRSRPVRVLGATVHALLLSFAFGVAGVLAVVHAFGGPRGDLAAPGWAIAALVVVAAACALALLATAGLVVEEVKAAGEEEE